MKRITNGTKNTMPFCSSLILLIVSGKCSCLFNSASNDAARSLCNFLFSLSVSHYLPLSLSLSLCLWWRGGLSCHVALIGSTGNH